MVCFPKCACEEVNVYGLQPFFKLEGNSKLHQEYMGESLCHCGLAQRIGENLLPPLPSPRHTAGSLKSFFSRGKQAEFGAAAWVFDIFHSASQGHLQSASESSVSLREALWSVCGLDHMCSQDVPRGSYSAHIPRVMWQGTTLLNPCLRLAQLMLKRAW